MITMVMTAKKKNRYFPHAGDNRNPQRRRFPDKLRQFQYPEDAKQAQGPQHGE